ncbi:hypothetical protein Tsubulata_010143 [Turnera subulata]|uniref:EF-hand domain-containing protein n=1 Tax=Turnera subulata TaxID=218843 RepID=A0A9Q0FLT9_9ROSI|nr:hypothetical protein Tsubulata_010143 [Turnera subulata]
MASHMVDFFLSVQKASLKANHFDNFQKFFSRFWFFIQSQFGLGNPEIWEDGEGQDSESSNQESSFDKKKDDRGVCRAEIELVMERLGLFCSPESGKLEESMGSDELSQLFDEKEPSLEEVREAFDVFDQNGDGFIDARELQRIFYCLGLKEGFDLENCRKMINTFDENEDGRIDFSEFVRFMENSFC